MRIETPLVGYIADRRDHAHAAMGSVCEEAIKAALTSGGSIPDSLPFAEKHGFAHARDFPSLQPMAKIPKTYFACLINKQLGGGPASSVWKRSTRPSGHT